MKLSKLAQTILENELPTYSVKENTFDVIYGNILYRFLRKGNLVSKVSQRTIKKGTSTGQVIYDEGADFIH